MCNSGRSPDPPGLGWAGSGADKSGPSAWKPLGRSVPTTAPGANTSAPKWTLVERRLLGEVATLVASETLIKQPTHPRPPHRAANGTTFLFFQWNQNETPLVALFRGQIVFLVFISSGYALAGKGKDGAAAGAGGERPAPGSEAVGFSPLFLPAAAIGSKACGGPGVPGQPPPSLPTT